MENDNIGKDISRGFDRLSKDIRGMTDKISRTAERMDRDLSNTARQANSKVGPVAERTANFLGETFTREYNKPALWSRDLVTMMGRTPRDMSQRQASAYATDHWNQRLGQVGSDVVTNLLPLAMYMFGGVPGMIGATAIEMLAPPEMSKARRINEYKAMIDRTSQNYMLSGNSTNSITGRGWNKTQRNEIAKFHAITENDEKLIDSNEQMMMAEIAGMGGYFKDIKTTDEYKHKYRKLIDGTKEAMKTLHMSLEEATGLMTEINNMRISDSPGFIRNVGLAAARSGMSSDQVISYAKNIGASLNMAGIEKEDAYNLATGMMTDNPGVNRHNIESVSNAVNSPTFIAGFMGEKGIDQDKVDSFLSGDTSYIDHIKRGANYLKSLDVTDLLKFDRNSADMLEKALGPETMVLVSGQAEYRKILDINKGNPDIDVDEVFLKLYKDRGYSPEHAKEVLAQVKTPGKDISTSSYYDQGKDVRDFTTGPNYLYKSIADTWNNTGITNWWNEAKIKDREVNQFLSGRSTPLGEAGSDLMKGQMIAEMGSKERNKILNYLGADVGKVRFFRATGLIDKDDTGVLHIERRRDAIREEYAEIYGNTYAISKKQAEGLAILESMTEVSEMVTAANAGETRYNEDELLEEYNNKILDEEQPKVKQDIRSEIEKEMSKVKDFKKDGGYGIYDNMYKKYKAVGLEKMFENEFSSYLNDNNIELKDSSMLQFDIKLDLIKEYHNNSDSTFPEVIYDDAWLGVLEEVKKEMAGVNDFKSGGGYSAFNKVYQHYEPLGLGKTVGAVFEMYMYKEKMEFPDRIDDTVHSVEEINDEFAASDKYRKDGRQEEIKYQSTKKDIKSDIVSKMASIKNLDTDEGVEIYNELYSKYKIMGLEKLFKSQFLEYTNEKEWDIPEAISNEYLSDEYLKKEYSKNKKAIKLDYDETIESIDKEIKDLKPNDWIEKTKELLKGKDQFTSTLYKSQLSKTVREKRWIVPDELDLKEIDDNALRKEFEAKEKNYSLSYDEIVDKIDRGIILGFKGIANPDESKINDIHDNIALGNNPLIREIYDNRFREYASNRNMGLPENLIFGKYGEEELREEVKNRKIVGSDYDGYTETITDIQRDVYRALSNVTDYNDDNVSGIYSILHPKWTGLGFKKMFENVWSVEMISKKFKHILVPGINTGGTSNSLDRAVEIATDKLYVSMVDDYGLDVDVKELETKLEKSPAYHEIVKGGKKREEYVNLLKEGVFGDLFKGKTHGEDQADEMAREYMGLLYKNIRGGSMRAIDSLQDIGINDALEEGGLQSGYTGLANAEIVEKNIQIFEHLADVTKYNSESAMLIKQATEVLLEQVQAGK